MRWVEVSGSRSQQDNKIGEELGLVHSMLASVSSDDLRVEFHSAKRDRASLSQAIKSLVSRKLVSAGWSERPYHQIKRLPGAHDLRHGLVALRFGFNHEAAVIRNLMMPTLESICSGPIAQNCTHWTHLILITATEEFRAMAGMDSAVGTFEDYEVCLRACERLLSVPVTVLGLLPTDEIRVVHERDYKGRKRGYVDTGDS